MIVLRARWHGSAGRPAVIIMIVGCVSCGLFDRELQRSWKAHALAGGSALSLIDRERRGAARRARCVQHVVTPTRWQPTFGRPGGFARHSLTARHADDRGACIVVEKPATIACRLSATTASARLPCMSARIRKLRRRHRHARTPNSMAPQIEIQPDPAVMQNCTRQKAASPTRARVRCATGNNPRTELDHGWLGTQGRGRRGLADPSGSRNICCRNPTFAQNRALRGNDGIHTGSRLQPLWSRRAEGWPISDARQTLTPPRLTRAGNDSKVTNSSSILTSLRDHQQCRAVRFHSATSRAARNRNAARTHGPIAANAKAPQAA